MLLLDLKYIFFAMDANSLIYALGYNGFRQTGRPLKLSGIKSDSEIGHCVCKSFQVSGIKVELHATAG